MWKIEKPLNNKLMKKINLICVLLFFGFPLVASARNSDIERTASELLFYLAAKDQILTLEQVEEHIARKDTSASLLYTRLEIERKKAFQEKASILKEEETPKSQVIYKALDIRRAALMEILALGKGVTPILMEAVNSARQDIVMGVIRGLRELKSEEALSVLVDVLERSPTGYTRFSDRVRREAIISLGEMKTHDERWKKLIQDGLFDADPKLRQMTREVIFKNDNDWGKAQLLVSWKHELKLYQQLRKNARLRNLQDLFDENGVDSIWVLKTLEALLLSKVSPDPVLPEELLTRFDFLRLLMLHRQVLEPALRQRIFLLALTAHQQSSIKIDALNALQESDKAQFSENVTALLTLQEDPEVLEAALKRFELWHLLGSRDKIGELALNSRQENIKILARKILERQL